MSNEFPVKWRLGVVDQLTAPLKKMSGAFKPVVDAAKGAQAHFDLLQKNTEKLRGSLTKIGKGTKDIGKSMMMGMTLPIAAFGATTIKTAVGFEESMNKVAALTRATGKPLEDMRNLAKKLGAETQFSASQAADAMSFLGMAGYSTNDILAATPGLLNLAAASGTDLARSADIASNILGAFGLAASETSRVADVLALTTASANVDMSMLAESMKDAAPVARQFGLSLEETSAAVGLLGNVGIQGSMAGTSLKNMMLNLSAPSSNVKKIFGALGIAVTDSAGKMRSLTDIFQDLGPALSKLPQSKQMAVLNEVFGKRAIAGGGELLTQAMKIGEDGKNAIQRFTDSLKDSNGAAQRMADTMMKGAPGAIKNMSSAFEGLQLAIAGSGVLDAFTFIVEKITELFRWLSTLNPTILKWAAGIAVVLAVLGPMIFGLGVLISLIPSLITGFALLKAGMAALGVTSWIALLPFIKFIAIAAILAASAYAIIDNWQTTKDFFKDLFTEPLQQIKDMLSYGGELARKAGSWFGWGDGKDQVDRDLEAQGFKMAGGASGPDLGADEVIKKSTEIQMRQQRATVDMNFSGMPKGTKVSTDNRDGILNLNTGMIGGF